MEALNDITCTFLLLYFGILSLSMTFPAKFIFSNLWHEKVNFGSYGKFQNQNENGVTLISSKSPDKRKHHRHEEESRMSGDVVQSVQLVQAVQLVMMIMVMMMANQHIPTSRNPTMVGF